MTIDTSNLFGMIEDRPRRMPLNILHALEEQHARPSEIAEKMKQQQINQICSFIQAYLPVLFSSLEGRSAEAAQDFKDLMLYIGGGNISQEHAIASSDRLSEHPGFRDLIEKICFVQNSMSNNSQNKPTVTLANIREVIEPYRALIARVVGGSEDENDHNRFQEAAASAVDDKVLMRMFSEVEFLLRENGLTILPDITLMNSIRRTAERLLENEAY